MDQVRTHQMQMHTLGDPKSFAFEVQGERVNILIGGKRITERDDSPYLLSFVTQLTATAECLRRRLNFLEHESLFNDLSVEEGYRALFDAFVGGNQPALDDAIRKLHFADWGPITDAYLTFLIPRWGRLYLATAPFDGGDVTAAEVIPYDLISTMRQVLEHLAAAVDRTMRSAIIRNLRGAASDGAGVCSLVGIIKKAMGPEANDFAVMSLFIDAFGVSFADIRELPGARCLGGAVYSDEEIEKLVHPAIQKTLGSRR